MKCEKKLLIPERNWEQDSTQILFVLNVHSHHYELAEHHHHLPTHLAVFRQGS